MSTEEVDLRSDVVADRATPDGRPVVGLTVTAGGVVLVHRTL